MDLGLRDKVVLVTGAGRGIGQAIALELAREGAQVIVNFFQSRKQAEELVEEIQQMGSRALLRQADVSSPAEVDAMFKTIKEAFGRLDGLVNNAGIGSRGKIEDLPYEVWERILKVNLTSQFLCSQAASKIMIEQRKGSMVNISSVGGIAPASGATGPHYAASKAGIIGLTKSMAVTLGQYNIRVNAVAPGLTITDLTAVFTPEQKEAIEKGTPLQRIADPEDIAYTVMFLLSDRARHITGQTIVVDGGRLKH